MEKVKFNDEFLEKLNDTTNMWENNVECYEIFGKTKYTAKFWMIYDDTKFYVTYGKKTLPELEHAIFNILKK
ncbi:hypothetical protein VB264_05355 [Arcicella aquatica]|uniref:DUF3805 domain-containing protein n=1 Tax=Arcicella aquatica TaxID=217141 RepID=A0ABU5QK50_9BACT|nr:hypothetical protein [Arcicella aquatica]MEA5257204.1 hypothetical protein [Arcicella aquatica]